MAHQVEGDQLREGPRSGQVPFSARKFADFPSNHGLVFCTSTSPIKQVVSKPSTHPSLQLVGTSGLTAPRCPDRQEGDLHEEHHQGLARRLRYRTDPEGTSDLPDRPNFRQSVRSVRSTDPSPEPQSGPTHI